MQRSLDALPEEFDIKDKQSRFLGHITTQKQTEMMLRAQTEILEMVATNQPLQAIFQRISKLNDEQANGVYSSIMLLDRDGKHFTDSVSAFLPEAYTKQFLGVEIGDNIGSCGTACFRKQTVIVEDIYSDPKWAPFRDAVRPFGYRSCWSSPIMRSDGSVAGSFALYSKSARKPTNFEAQLFDVGTWLASIAIESHSAVQAVRIAAETDPLTGLNNRGNFSRQQQAWIKRARQDESRFATIFIDLDGFKLVNDRYGHKVGDDYLKLVGARMREIGVDDYVMARVGGDEFALLRTVEGEIAQLKTEVETFMHRLSQPLDVHGLRLSVSGTAGVAIFPDHGNLADTLLTNADSAMYYAKKRGSGQVKLYNVSIDNEHRSREMRIAALEKAITHGEIDLDFQPQFDLVKGGIDGFEALARWQHPQLGRLSPAYFIDLAEEAGLIVPLGGSVLNRACKRAKSWSDKTGKWVSVAVNVSALQFTDGIILEQVRQALSKSGLPAACLELELTETALADTKSAAATMAELHGMGVRTALDDFGTGYSNLSALAAMPLDRLKIDRSIIQDIPGNPAAASIASAIIAMGQKLEMKVLAEGVETREQLDFLKENDCDAAQGYYLGRPVSFEDALAMLINSELDVVATSSRR
nr:EAL domain-containing protein [Rhizobium sp. L1K21]